MRVNAVELVCELKALMPMVSDQQADLVLKAMMERDDTAACRRAVHGYASSYEQFTVAGFLDHLPPRPDAGIEPWDVYEYERSKMEGESIEAGRDADNAVCERLDDATYNRIAGEMLATLDAEVADLFRRRKSLRNSQWLRSLVADRVRAEGVPT